MAVSTQPSDAQIDAEVATLVSLKLSVRQFSFFGDSNHEAMDAQIRVLRERMNRMEFDEIFRDIGIGGHRRAFNFALDALDWMTGTAAESIPPSSAWDGMK